LTSDGLPVDCGEIYYHLIAYHGFEYDTVLDPAPSFFWLSDDGLTIWVSTQDIDDAGIYYLLLNAYSGTNGQY